MCRCISGFYDNALELDVIECTACTGGMNCSASGVTLELLPLRRGYWRRNNHSDNVKFCEADGPRLNADGDWHNKEGACVGGLQGCKNKTGGPYCSACLPELQSTHYYTDSSCVPCSDGNESSAMLIVAVVA